MTVDDEITNPTSNRPFRDVMSARLSRRDAMVGGLAAAATTFFFVEGTAMADPKKGGTWNGVGGTSKNSGNLISGNRNEGIQLGNTSSVLVAGNRVGTTATGTSPLGNGCSGIVLSHANEVAIGGINPQAANVIALSHGTAGIVVTNCPVEGSMVTRKLV